MRPVEDLLSTSSVSNGAAQSVGPRLLYCGGQEPLFVAALAFACGIVAANYVWRSPLVWLGAFLACCFAGGLLDLVPPTEVGSGDLKEGAFRHDQGRALTRAVAPPSALTRSTAREASSQRRQTAGPFRRGGLGMTDQNSLRSRALTRAVAPQLAYAFLLSAIAALGAFYLQAYDAAQITPPSVEAFATGEGEVMVTGDVMREGLVRDSPYGGKQESVDVESEELATTNHTSRAQVGIRLTIYSKRSEEAEAESSGGESPLHVYTYGERLRFPAKLRMPRNYGNPGALDLAGYLASQGIRLTGSARASDIEVLPGFEGRGIGLWRARARRSILAHIQQLWPGERGQLMQAMLIGGRAFFGREIKTEFQRTGTYHILVVSGINVGILAFAVFWALRKLPFGETTATVLTILLSCGYAFVADLGAPIVRATIVLNIYLVTRLLFRDRAGLNALGIAALGILLVNPRALFEASFQLTFLSVIAVAGIAVPVLRRAIYPLQNALRNLGLAYGGLPAAVSSGAIPFEPAPGARAGGGHRGRTSGELPRHSKHSAGARRG